MEIVFVMGIVVVILLLMIALWYYLSYVIMGLFKPFRACKLKDIDKQNIKLHGLIHKTTSKGKIGILRDQRVNGKAGVKAYSCQFRKTAFFFAKEYINIDSEEYNDNSKYDYEIHINNITDEQLEKMRIRSYDNAIMVLGDLDIGGNDVIVKEIPGNKQQKFKRFIGSNIKVLFTPFFWYLLLSCILSAVLCLLITMVVLGKIIR